VSHFELKGVCSQIELLEMFNEKLLIKLESKPLRIFNILTQEWKVVENFEAPTAFIFLHDQYRFFTIDQHSILSLWTVDGVLLKRFDEFKLCKMLKREKDYIIEKSSNNRFFIVNSTKGTRTSLLVIDIEKQEVVGELRGSSPRLQSVTKSVTAIQYDENNHEIVTGHNDGSLKFWSM